MVEPLEIPGTRQEGCSRIALERLRAGELADEPAASLRSHVASCSRCRGIMDELEREAQAFAEETDFARFRAGVERAGGRRERARWAGPAALALAASLAALIFVVPVLTSGPDRNGLKGSASLDLYAGGAGAAPRLLGDREALAAGERLRLGYRPDGKKFLLVLSVDDEGEVSPIYPEAGASLAAAANGGLLPDSVELTGEGLERVIAVFSDEPLQIAAAVEAARREYAGAGALEKMGELKLGGEQVSRLVRKSGKP